MAMYRRRGIGGAIESSFSSRNKGSKTGVGPQEHDKPRIERVMRPCERSLAKAFRLSSRKFLCLHCVLCLFVLL